MRVAASIKPVPATTTGTPAAAMVVGVMDVSTGRVASVTQVSQVTGRVAALVHATDTLTAASGPVARSVAIEGWLAFHPIHSAASARPGMQVSDVHGTPATDADATCGTLAAHRATPVIVMLMTGLSGDCAGGSSSSSVLAPSVGVACSSVGTTPLTLNAPPASCTTAAVLAASVADVVHDSVVDDSHDGLVHSLPPSHTIRLSMVACTGGCLPTAVQSAAVSRGAGRCNTMRPLPGVSGANPRPPPGARATGGGGSSKTVALSRCGTPPVPACATQTNVSTGAVVAAGSMNGSAHVVVVLDTAIIGPHDTLAAVG